MSKSNQINYPQTIVTLMHSAKRLFAVADIKEPRHAADASFMMILPNFILFCVVLSAN